MEVKIGVVYTPKELIVETDESADAVAEILERGLADGHQVVWLTDSKGRRVGVPSDKIAYVELGTEESQRTVGFGR